jgi:RND superfamily putative drug exporter
MWAQIADRVMRRPVLATVLAGGLLVALTIPAFGLKTQETGADSVPKDLPGVAAYYDIREAFPGKNTEAVVAVEAQDTRSGPAAGAIGRLRQTAQADSHTVGAIEVDRSSDGGTAEITIPIAGDGNNQASKNALANLREELIPAAFAGVDAQVAVTGTTAESVDFNDLLASRMPIVFAFVLGFAFLLMLVTFRSIVIPIKTIVLNLLSVGAAYGVLVLVFQNGIGESLLGFESTGAIAPWVPLFLFVVLFGLSMDYHVFILSRVREAVDRGMSTEDAVRDGLTRTGGIVTSAALVMVAVFSIFATLSFVEMKEMGVGLAVAVLLDATLVRAVLLPTAMKLLGDWNWYLPRRLQWLPKVGGERTAEPAAA